MNGPTWADAAANYLDYVQRLPKKETRPRSVEGAERAMRRITELWGAEKPLRGLKTRDLERLQAKLSDFGIGNTTVNGYVGKYTLAALRRAARVPLSSVKHPTCAPYPPAPNRRGFAWTPRWCVLKGKCATLEQAFARRLERRSS